MNPQFPAEDALFDAARHLSDPATRAAFLNQVCAGNPALRQRLEALLRASPEAEDFFDQHAGGLNHLPPLSGEEPTLIASPSEQAGERIGRYKLLQEIGEGGFGTVWMAEQVEPVTRRVALKIIKLGMDTREVIARFEAERQALAMMDHPNIAKVLDAGATDKGRPFFVMELVKGTPITTYCDEAQLGMKERLALFGDVCSAIQHAHQKGIIHRDIKPSNVMVTMHGDKAVVKVIDFGIAKATQGKLTDKTLFTRFEQFIGTPVYMSPEQAATSGLDIDTRSDIYALGILLYELLTGKPPFDAKTLASAGYEEMRRIIREVEPPKPSSRLSTVAGAERATLAKARHIEPEKLSRIVEPDLDWIVMKAIEKDRTRRYETASGLAADIQRFLSDEPVSATPPSAGYRFRKFARRNRTALRVVAVFAAVLVAATVVSLQQALRATNERNAKERALKDSESIATFLAEVLQSPDPARDGRTITVAEKLDAAARELDNVAPGDPLHRAMLHGALGLAYHGLGLFRPAVEQKEKALVIYEAELGREAPETLRTMNNLAISYASAGRFQEALTLDEEVLAVRRRTIGTSDPETLGSMMNAASSLCDLGRQPEALNLLKEAYGVSRTALGTESETTLGIAANLAAAYSDVTPSPESLKMGEETWRLMSKVLGPEHLKTLIAMGRLAGYYLDANQNEEALRLREDLVPLALKRFGPRHSFTLGAKLNLATSCGQAGRLEDEIKLEEEVLPVIRSVLSPTHPDAISAAENLSNSLMRAGQFEKALELKKEVVALCVEVFGPEKKRTLDAMIGQADALFYAGQQDESIKLSEKIVPICRRTLGMRDETTFRAMYNLGCSYADAGKPGNALELEKELVPMSVEIFGANHINTQESMKGLARAYHETGHEKEAQEMRERWIAMTPSAPTSRVRPYGLEPKEDRPSNVDKSTAAAPTEPAPGAPAPSAPTTNRRDARSLKEALENTKKTAGAESAEAISAMIDLANAQEAEGDARHSVSQAKEALEAARRTFPKRDEHTIEVMKLLVRLYKSANLDADARKLEAEMQALKGGT